MTQGALSDATGIHLTEIWRYEGGIALPTFEILRKLALRLGSSADTRVFDSEERRPDEELRLQFEAGSSVDHDEKHTIEGILLQHQHAESAQRLADVS